MSEIGFMLAGWTKSTGISPEEYRFIVTLQHRHYSSHLNLEGKKKKRNGWAVLTFQQKIRQVCKQFYIILDCIWKKQETVIDSILSVSVASRASNARRVRVWTKTTAPWSPKGGGIDSNSSGVFVAVVLVRKCHKPKQDQCTYITLPDGSSEIGSADEQLLQFIRIHAHHPFYCHWWLQCINI